jgi:predicted TIM-barrel fold metal-dependent hydrolase
VRIDVHAHYYPQHVLDEFTRIGSPRGYTGPSGGLTIAERLEWMDRAGIDVQVMSMGVGQPYLPDVEKAVAGARCANDAYKELVDGSDGRFAAFGCLPLPHVDAALAETARCLDELGMAGLNLGCSVAGRPLEDPAFEPLWADLNRRRAVVFLHPLGVGGPFIDAFGLEMMVGSRFEDTICAVRLVLSGLTRRYPDVRIIVPHLGGTIPYLWERIEESGGRRTDVRPKEEFKRLYYDSVNKTPAALRCFCETVGADRLMLGTDFPYVTEEMFKGYVSYIGESDLAPEQVRAILDENAQALLQLPERKG